MDKGKYVGSSLFVVTLIVQNAPSFRNPCSKCFVLLRLTHKSQPGLNIIDDLLLNNNYGQSSCMHDMVHGICEVCHKVPSIKGCFLASWHTYIKDTVSHIIALPFVWKWSHTHWPRCAYACACFGGAWRTQNYFLWPFLMFLHSWILNSGDWSFFFIQIIK